MSLIPRIFYPDEFLEGWDDLKPARFSDMKCDIYESDGNYNIEMDIPGYDKKDIKIECDEGLLTITAEKKNEKEEKDEDKKYIRRERSYGKVSRSFNLNDIDEDNIKAEFKDGILKITVPKTEEVETKKVIEID